MRKGLIFLMIVILIALFITGIVSLQFSEFVYIGIMTIAVLIISLLLLQSEVEKEERNRKDRYIK